MKYMMYFLYDPNARRQYICCAFSEGLLTSIIEHLFEKSWSEMQSKGFYIKGEITTITAAKQPIEL